MVFVDRADAGRRLASMLSSFRYEPVVVLGVPRGGVPVAYEVARALDAPLDVIVVRKLGVPFRPELGMGAIGEDGACIINTEVARLADISPAEIADVEKRERLELERRVGRYRADRPRVSLEGRTALVVDDGVDTGSTARAACRVARAQGAVRVVLAVPVAPLDWKSRMSGEADELIVIETPEPFWAIGESYANYSPTSDETVIACLVRAADRAVSTRDASAGVAKES